MCLESLLHSEGKKSQGADGTGSEGEETLMGTLELDLKGLTTATDIPIVALQGSAFLDPHNGLIGGGLLVSCGLSDYGDHTRIVRVVNTHEG